MVKIIVAFATDEKCAQYASVLEEAGIPVFRRCTSASEVRRTMNQCGDAIILTSCKLPDSTIDALAWDLGKQAVILSIGRPAQLEFCEHPDLFKLPAPFSKGELTSAVNMLVQLHQMRLPRRTSEEKEIIAKAKELLMTQYAMTEPEAHHHLQKGAMDRGMKMTDFAARLLETNQ
ncbi:MAG: ANTAR domain-containing protein [Christensenellales bacterium]|nr:ANTAR domain-containing protein [Christensenellales bacterium]